MLTLLTIISTLGGSINVKEHFDEEHAADRDDIAPSIGGEIIRASEYGGVPDESEHEEGGAENDEYGGDSETQGGSEQKAVVESDGAMETYSNDERKHESERGDKNSQQAVIEPFDGDMYAAYGR